MLLNKRKIVICSVMIVVFIVIILGNSYFFKLSVAPKETSNSFFTDKETKKINSDLKKLYGMSDEKINELTYSQKIELLSIDENYAAKWEEVKNQSALDTGEKDVTEHGIYILKDTMLINIGNREYSKAIQEYDEWRQEYDLTSESAIELRYIYDTAIAMNNIVNTGNYSVVSSFLPTFKEPKSFILAILTLPENSRRNAFIDTSSLSPVTTGKVRINSSEKISNSSEDIILESDIVSKFYSLGYENYSMFDISIEINNETLNAYVVQNNDNKKCMVYKIISKNNKTNFKTVDFYNNLDSR